MGKLADVFGPCKFERSLTEGLLAQLLQHNDRERKRELDRDKERGEPPPPLFSLRPPLLNANARAALPRAGGGLPTAGSTAAAPRRSPVPWDLPRVVDATVPATLIDGTLTSAYYDLLERWIPGTALRSVGLKALIGSALFGPLSNGATLLLIMLLASARRAAGGTTRSSSRPRPRTRPRPRAR